MVLMIQNKFAGKSFHMLKPVSSVLNENVSFFETFFFIHLVDIYPNTRVLFATVF